jgi:hypothetical protein
MPVVAGTTVVPQALRELAAQLRVALAQGLAEEPRGEERRPGSR